MRVGISLLTLAPGDLGGSETYARQLVTARSLPCGRLDYTVFVPAHAKDAAGSLPATEVGESPMARRGPARVLGMALSAFRSRAVKSELETVDVVHYALTVPSGDQGAHGRHPARRAASGSSGVLRSGAALVQACRIRPRHALGLRGGRDQRVRARPGARAPRADPRPSTWSTWGQPHALSAPETRNVSRSCCIPRGPGRTRTTPVVRSVRHPPQDASSTAPRAHGRRSERLGRLPRASSARESSEPPSWRRCTGARQSRCPEPVPRVRAPAAGGDGVRLPGRRSRHERPIPRSAAMPPSSSTR